MITKVHISSSEMLINTGDGQKSSLPIFHKDQIVTAKVLQLLPPGKARLLVNGQKLMAKTTLPLTLGEQVQLKVLTETDAVVLKLIGPAQKLTTRQISSLVGFFAKNRTMPDILGSKIPGVKELLFDMALKSDKPDDTFLPRLLEKSGMVWEKKVAQVVLGNSSLSNMKDSLNSLLQQDLKGNILQELLTADSRKSDALKIAASFIESTENFQMLNHQSSESGRILLPFPIFSEGAFRFGQLFIDTGDKTRKNNKDANKIIQVSFLLDMSRLGPLRADFSILKQEITGRFLLTDEDICQYVESKMFELAAGLEGLGYHVRRIDCQTAEKEEIRQNIFIENLVKTQGDNILNIVV